MLKQTQWTDNCEVAVPYYPMKTSPPWSATPSSSLYRLVHAAANTVQLRCGHGPDQYEGTKALINSHSEALGAVLADEDTLYSVLFSAQARYMLRQRPCDLYMVGDLSITGAYAFAYRPGWGLADKVDSALLMLRENGILKVLEDKWFAGQCHNNVLDPMMRDKIQVKMDWIVSGHFFILFFETRITASVSKQDCNT